MPTGLKHRLDYSDLAALPADGKRYELVDGKLLVTPSPSPAHQWASRRLQRQIEDYVEARGLGVVFNAPLDVILAPHDVVEPDILVVADKRQISARGIEGSPSLVVEVVSPSTATTDRGTKAQRYASAGIRSYWVVDPQQRSIECYRLDGATYTLAAQAEGVGRLQVPDWPEFTVELDALWL